MWISELSELVELARDGELPAPRLPALAQFLIDNPGTLIALPKAIVSMAYTLLRDGKCRCAA
jgi:hypothetical protein